VIHAAPLLGSGSDEGKVIIGNGLAEVKTRDLTGRGNEDTTAELQVRLPGEGTDGSWPTRAINIGDGLFQLNAWSLYDAMTRGSK
jgi:hypothetical protein